MGTQEIIERLCNHEFSKGYAIELIEEKLDALRRKGDFEFRVVESSFTVQNDDAVLKIVMPGGHRAIQHVIKVGDKIDVTPIN